MNAPVFEPTARVLRAHTRPGSSTLEIGCGAAQYRSVVRGRYVGLDRRSDLYEGPGEPDVLADAGGLPFAAGTFDLVFYVGVFHLLVDPVLALREAIRVSRRDGRILIFDYSVPTLRRLEAAYRPNEPILHANVLGSDDWFRLLRGAGLTDVSVRRNTPRPAMRFVQRLMPRVLSHALVDAKPASIVVAGRVG